MLFARAILPVRRFQDFGVKIGLGTDISGGHSINMLSAIRMAGLVSRVPGFRMMDDEARAKEPSLVKEEGKEEREKREMEVVDWKRGLWMATRGGAEAGGWENVGGFEVGWKWDAVEVEVRTWEDIEDGEEETVGTEEEEKRRVEERLERWVVGHGGQEGVRSVWVDGRLVFVR